MNTHSGHLRQSFLEFFKSKDHTLVPSDSLIPSSDPTLLFTSAGMVQFKPHFLQQIPLTFHRAASSQRCLRTTDIDQVGITPRHLTLFEMLGNFSFGDYFKEEAIAWGWEYLTQTLSLPTDRLWITIYKDDEEAEQIWKKIVPANRIIRMGEETNFWTMGPTGPCGPCSEIHWDFSGDKNTRGPDDSPRWMEVWNLVFTQFDRQTDGTLVPLPKKNIDTGMGLERLSSIVEGVSNNFETSLLKPLLQYGEEIFKYKMGGNDKKDTALKIIADHLRAVTLLVYDGVLPSNEGRGYVLRRLLRRAVRQGALFKKEEPFLFEGVPLVAEIFKDTTKEITKKTANLASIIRQEEERFLETIETGLGKLDELVAAAKKSKRKAVKGEEVFRLYDTYGFPPELTKEILCENGITFNEGELQKSIEEAQDKARMGWKGSGAKDMTIYNDVLKKIGPSRFKGYKSLSARGPIQFMLKDGKPVDVLKTGEKGEVFTLDTPFYPEGGGQVGDKGFLKMLDGEVAAIIGDAQKPVPGLISHHAVAKNDIKVGLQVEFCVDPGHRDPTKRHHTATHLLHAALRRVLGTSVTQAGSLVEPDRLRFDYSTAQAPTPDEIESIEDLVNQAVLNNYQVEPKITTPDEARKMGAMALFGEKYGDEVRCLIISSPGVENMGQAFSLELCGGTHVSFTGEIGAFKILSDSSLAAGVRRIEAIAGLKAVRYLRKLESQVHKIAAKIKTSPDEIENRITKLMERQKLLEQEVRDLKIKLAHGGGDSPAAEVIHAEGIPLIIKVTENMSISELRTLADRLKEQIKSGVIFVATTNEDEGKVKISFVVAVTPDVQAKGLNAGHIAKTISSELGGSGGGRADFAQGGGQDRVRLDLVLKKIPALINKK